ncbi:MAG: serine protease [Clostridia bacterium]|nr:serine protease [Clostridia bacterium]
MKKFLFLLICCICITSCGNLNTNTYPKGKMINIEQISEIGLSETLSPAIVGVYSASNSGGNIGAGVCINEHGHIITNAHVVNNTSNPTLYLHNGERCNSELLYQDSVLDFAILKSQTPLPYLPVSIEDLSVGENVIAVGTPISLMLKHTYTKGIVSAINRTIKIGTTSGESYMQNLIQHDASLNPGNSGGPLINSKGEVVGINTLKITSGEGLGFAIPVKSFISLLDNLHNNIDNSPYLGVYGYDAEIAKFNKLSNTDTGFYVENISSTSPASDLLIEGDIIVAINGNKITNASDLRYELYKYSANDIIELTYMSNNRLYTKQLKLQKRSI